MLTTADIVRLTGRPARTVRDMLNRWRASGEPVVTVPRRGPGRPALAISRGDFVRLTAFDLDAADLAA